MNIIRKKFAPAQAGTLVDEALDTFFNDFFYSPTDSFGDYSYTVPFRTDLPPVNTIKTGSGYRLEIAMPGINQDDITISVEDDMIKVSFAAEETKDSAQYARQEFSSKSFNRSFKLPRGTEYENISASYDRGILSLDIPNYRVVEQKSRIIEIS